MSMTTTARRRQEARALSRAVERRHKHETRFGPLPEPRPLLGTARIAPDGSVRMSWATFQGGDYGQVCQLLGLRPSRPNHTADGRRAKRGRR